MSGGPAPAAGSDTTWEEDLAAWRAHREERLRAADGWLTLVGLHWLEEGEQTFGSSDDNDLVFPGKAPARIGKIIVTGGRARAEIDPGAAVRMGGETVSSVVMRSDAEGPPTELTLGDLSFFLIQRGDRLGIRVKDSRSPVLVDFSGIERFPDDPAWRLDARFEPYDPPKPIPVPNVLGTADEQTSSGALAFEAGGQTHRLDVIAEPGADRLFVIFADETSGQETYGGGRYIYTDAPAADGRVEIDFNRAYNPPCVFTPYATCPLPPRQNRLLGLRVEAGEKTYGEH